MVSEVRAHYPMIYCINAEHFRYRDVRKYFHDIVVNIFFRKMKKKKIRKKVRNFYEIIGKFGIRNIPSCYTRNIQMYEARILMTVIC